MIPAVLGGAGLVVGFLLPWIVARIPDRVAPTARARSYRELAARRGLRPVLAAATAVVWALIGLAHAELGVAIVAYLLVGALGVALAYIDIREHRLPDWLTLPAFGVAAAALAVAAAVSGEWPDYGRAWAGAAAALAFYLALALLRPADLGLGDVKLAPAIGLLLGWLGWPVLVLGVFAGFAVGAVTAVALVVTAGAGRRTAIPFGPAMLAGTLIAVVWGDRLVDAYLGI